MVFQGGTLFLSLLIPYSMPMKSANDQRAAREGKPSFWNSPKRYYDFRSYLKNTFGARVAKLPIDAGFTCPNRDGSRGRGGCIYCDGRGSSLRREGPLPPVAAQLGAMRERYRRGGAEKYIAYFQTFTGTYAPIDELRRLYSEAVNFSPDIVGLSVGTRPDCLSGEVLDLLASYRSRCRVWLELGVQSLHAPTLERINRGHSLEELLDAVERASSRGLELVAHVILGLPGESPEPMRATARRLASLPFGGLKIHLPLVLEGTGLAGMYRRGEVSLPSREEYAGWVADFLELTRPEVSIQRLTADGYRDIFIAPDWARGKLAVLNAIDDELKRRQSWQGKHVIMGTALSS
jgi:radical SAM protein (TIGR01212 family)